MRRVAGSIWSVLALLLVVSCSGEEVAEPEGADIGAAQSKVHDYMYQEVQPAAEGIWDNAGWILTAEGEEELFPTTDAGWQGVVVSAEDLEAIAATLNTPEFAVEERIWSISSDKLAKAARVAKRAAVERDKQKLFDAGGEVYRACLSCHLRYARETTLRSTVSE